MNKNSENSYNDQLRKGMLVLVLLKLIDKHEVYVAEMLTQLQSTEFATQEGTLYPLLARLKKEGLISHRWEESESGPPRKYYSLTAEGKEQVKELEVYLKTLAKQINSIGGVK